MRSKEWSYLEGDFDLFIKDFFGDGLMLGFPDVGDKSPEILEAPKIIAVGVVITENVSTSSLACFMCLYE